jgi:hypothetical protein
LAHLAERWAEQADVTRLHVLLLQARIVLADLAGTKQGIADMLPSLEAQVGPEAAARWRQAAAHAAREAESARTSRTSEAAATDSGHPGIVRFVPFITAGGTGGCSSASASLRRCAKGSARHAPGTAP